MVEASDIAIFSGVSIIAVAVIAATGVVQLPGTNTSNIACSIPILSNAACSSEDVEPRYDLQTEITVSGISADVNLKDFKYSTTESGFSLSILGPGQSLAFGGGNEVEVDFQLYDSNNNLVADGNKFIGEVGTLESEKVNFNVNNLEKGDYQVKYRLKFKRDFELVEGSGTVKTLSKDIRIPKRIE